MGRHRLGQKAVIEVAPFGAKSGEPDQHPQEQPTLIVRQALGVGADAAAVAKTFRLPPFP